MKNNVYVHRNVIKKIKRDDTLFEKVVDFVQNRELTFLTEHKGVEYIKSDAYEDKLLYKKSVVFDFPMDLESWVIWDIYNEDSEYISAPVEQYEQSPVLELIKGNQFVKKQVEEDEDIRILFKGLRDSKSTELDYCLDEHQSNILNTFNHSHQKNQAISGPAGAGKTLMLNRLAYEGLINKQKFIYIVFTSTLKDKFLNFINDALRHNQALGNMDDFDIDDYASVFTYEEFLRVYIAPKVGLQADKYVTFNECNVFVKNYLLKMNSNQMPHFSMNDLCRILMSMSLNDGKKSSTETINRRINRLVSNNDFTISEKDRELVVKLAGEFELYVKKTLKKALWNDFINDIDQTRVPGVEYIAEDCILIDEMQDLAQAEFDLLEKLVKNTSYEKKKFILAYDANQQISLEGSTKRNLLNRFKCEPTSLKYSYRNSQNILKLSQNFLTDDEDESKQTADSIKVNINSNKIKVLIENDMEHVILNQTKKFIPEENLNVGILAFGNTYETYRDDFVDENGRSKYVGIEFFNEEQIKGLEFTNLIILDFMELYRSKSSISKLELRRWYVGITRACENLMLHFSTEEELNTLIDYLTEVLEKESLKEDNSITYFKDSEEAFSAFKKDLAISLGDEQKTLLLTHAIEMINKYESNNNRDLLEDGIDLLYKTNSIHTLINILERLPQKDEFVYLELVKAFIFVNDKENCAKYIDSIDKNNFWKIIDFALEHNKQFIPFLDNFKSDKSIGKNKAVGRIVYKAKELAEIGEYNEAIALLNAEGMHDRVIQFYTMNDKVPYSDQSLKYIGRAYEKTNQNEKALSFYLEKQQVKLAVQMCEIAGEFHKAFEICRNRLDVGYDEVLLSKAVDLALRICDEAVLNDMIEISKKYNHFEMDKLYFDLYILSNELEHLMNAIKYSYLKGKYKAVIRFYHKEENRLKDKADIAGKVASSLENEQQIWKAAEIYYHLENYDKALELYYENGNYEEVSEISELISLLEDEYKFDFISNHQRRIIESFEHTGETMKAIEVCKVVEDVPMAIMIAANNELHAEVTALYEDSELLNCKKSLCYQIEEPDIVQRDLYKKIAHSYAETEQFRKGGDIYFQYLNALYEAVKLYDKSDAQECIISIFEEKYENLNGNEAKKTNFMLDFLQGDFELWGIQDIEVKSRNGCEKFAEILAILIRIYDERNDLHSKLRWCLLSEDKAYYDDIIHIYYHLEEYEKLNAFCEDKQLTALSNQSKAYLARSYEQMKRDQKAKGIYIALLKSFTRSYKMLDAVMNKQLSSLVEPGSFSERLMNKKLKDLKAEEVAKSLLTESIQSILKQDAEVKSLPVLTLQEIIQGQGYNKLLQEIKMNLDCLANNDKMIFNKDDISEILELNKELKRYLDEDMRLQLQVILYRFLQVEAKNGEHSAKGIKELTTENKYTNCLDVLKDLSDARVAQHKVKYVTEFSQMIANTFSSINKEHSKISNEQREIANNQTELRKEKKRLKQDITKINGQLKDIEKELQSLREMNDINSCELLEERTLNEKELRECINSNENRMGEIEEQLNKNKKSNSLKSNQLIELGESIIEVNNLLIEFFNEHWDLFSTEFNSNYRFRNQYLLIIRAHLQHLVDNLDSKIGQDNLKKISELYKRTKQSLNIEMQGQIKTIIYHFLQAEMKKSKPTDKAVKRLTEDVLYTDCFDLIMDMEAINQKKLDRDYLTALFQLAHNAIISYENQLQRILAKKAKETKAKKADSNEELSAKVNLVHQYVYRFLERYWNLFSVFFIPAKELIESPYIEFKIEQDETKKVLHVRFKEFIFDEVLERKNVAAESVQVVQAQGNEKNVQMQRIIGDLEIAVAQQEQTGVREKAVTAIEKIQVSDEEKGDSAVDLNLDLDQQLRKKEKSVLIEVAKKAIKLGTIETNDIAAITDIPIEKIEEYKRFLAMDEEERRILMD